jgi:low temperature requirement protein LtrA
MSERRTAPVELLWDLVFVFALTQVTAFLAHDLDWTGFGRGMLILALIWWAWSAFVWAANAQDYDALGLRLTLVLAMVLIFVAGLAVPHAFGEDATLFAFTYAAVRLLHLALYADASRRGNASWAAIAGFGVTVLAGMGLLIAGSYFEPSVQTALWAAAVAIDYAGPAWLTRERLRGLQRVAVAHFAERYGLFIIICLGESIIAIGVGAGGHDLDLGLAVAAALGVLVVVGLWWVYFDRVAPAAEQRLRDHGDPVLAAADAYSYMHLLLVAGIIVFAVGMKETLSVVSDPLSDSARLALTGGVALYLAGHAAFRARMFGTGGLERLAAAAAALLLYPVGEDLPAWSLEASLAVVLIALCAWDASRREEVAIA